MTYDDDQIRERIIKLLHREELTQLDFSSKIGRSQSNVSDLMRGRRPITQGFLIDILKAFPTLRKDWLSFGEGKMYEGDNDPTSAVILDTRPRLPKTFADGNIEDFLKNHRDKCDEKPKNPLFAEYEFTLILKNDRMSPKYQRGDELAFRKTSIVEWGNDYLLDTAEGPKFKKIFKIDGGVRCVSYNKKEYPDFEIPLDKIYGFYKCVGMTRVL